MTQSRLDSIKELNQWAYEYYVLDNPPSKIQLRWFVRRTAKIESKTRSNNARQLQPSDWRSAGQALINLRTNLA